MNYLKVLEERNRTLLAEVAKREARMKNYYSDIIFEGMDKSLHRAVKRIQWIEDFCRGVNAGFKVAKQIIELLNNIKKRS